MKKTFASLLITAILLLSSIVSFGQASICLGIDAVACPGNTITINDCGGAGAGGSPLPYVAGLIPYSPDPFSGTNVFLSDDSFSGVINIGFDFCFYGNTYNQLVISSNNLVSFNTAYAGGYSSWVTTPIPTAMNHLNSIMGPWQDINPSSGGTVSYASYGTAPNRRFVISWNSVPMFSCGTSYTSQITLFETTNLIETHIQDKYICSGWNSGNAVHGVQNITGTNALTVPGRNNTQWTTSNEGYLFTPQSTITWTNNLGQTFPYNTGVLNITTIPPGVTGYWLESASCGPGISISDTSWISGGGSTVTASAIDDICSAGIGEVTATPTSGLSPYTFDWTSLGNNPNQTVTGVSAGTHTVIMTDSNGCSSTATVVVGDTPAAFTGSMTLVSCPGGNDGTAYAEMIPLLGTVTYQWDDPALQTTQTATGLTAGTYNCTITSTIGCAGVVTINVAEVPGMIGVISSQTDVTCNSASDGVITVSINQGTAPYTYSWDNSSSTTNSATDLAAGPHTVTITDSNGCIISVSGILNQPAPLSINSLTPTTQICPEDDILLSVSGIGGSTPYTFTWTQGSTQLGTGPSITVNPAVSNTQYCVTLSEACGSPTDQECTIIYFPTPIVPMATPDETEKCMPGYFEFTNISSNAAEIATTYWDFGDNQGASLELTDDSTSYQYNVVGVYDVIMLTTSIYGCVYTDTMKQIVQVKPNPIADFTFSTNPVTIFESAGIQMQDRSSNDAVIYSWFSPFSIPSTSTQIQPIFDFPNVQGSYPVTLIVETALGCLDTTTINMNVITDILFFAPNAFTPDGDELNQTWKVEVAGVDIYDFELFIFNRWGEIIWETRDPSVGWDGTYKGKIVMSGSYIWKANVKDLYTDEKVQFNGNINLLK